MATAPLLLLIVAALPRAEAAVAPGAELAAPAVCVRALSTHLDDEQRPQAPALTLAPPRVKRPAREPLVEALAQPVVAPGLPPALAPRTEPGDARGPPSTWLSPV